MGECSRFKKYVLAHPLERVPQGRSSYLTMGAANVYMVVRAIAPNPKMMVGVRNNMRICSEMDSKVASTNEGCEY